MTTTYLSKKINKNRTELEKVSLAYLGPKYKKCAGIL